MRQKLLVQSANDDGSVFSKHLLQLSNRLQHWPSDPSLYYKLHSLHLDHERIVEKVTIHHPTSS